MCASKSSEALATILLLIQFNVCIEKLDQRSPVSPNFDIQMFLLTCVWGELRDAAQEKTMGGSPVKELRRMTWHSGFPVVSDNFEQIVQEGIGLLSSSVSCKIPEVPNDVFTATLAGYCQTNFSKRILCHILTKHYDLLICQLPFSLCT